MLPSLYLSTSVHPEKPPPDFVKCIVDLKMPGSGRIVVEIVFRKRHLRLCVSTLDDFWM